MKTYDELNEFERGDYATVDKAFADYKSASMSRDGTYDKATQAEIKKYIKALDKMKSAQLYIKLIEHKMQNGSMPKWANYRIDEKGKLCVVSCKENMQALLDFDGIEVCYDEMSKRVIINADQKYCKATWDNSMLQHIEDLASRYQYKPTDVVKQVQLVGATNERHPVRDWILSVKWDGVSRIPALLGSMTIDERLTTKEMAQKMLTKWMTAAVAAVMYGTEHQNEEHERSGFKGVEGVLVLQGNQGISKTKWLSALVPVHNNWLLSGVWLDPHNKDSVAKLIGHWVCELGELDGTFKKADHAALKAFLTDREDVIRLPFERKADRHPRRTVFCASVNDREVLRYDDGSRRWWMIGVTGLNSEHGIDLQQLWAEVYENYYMKCEPYWMLPEEREELYRLNESFTTTPEVVEKAERFIDLHGTESLLIGEILERLGIRNDVMTSRQLGHWLRSKGLERNGNKRWRVSVDNVEDVQIGSRNMKFVKA